MTISQYASNNLSGSPYTFGGITSHQTIYDEGWEFQDTEEVFYGVQGSQQTLDKLHGRWLRLQVDLFGFETEALLRSALNQINSYSNVLQGPLTIDSTMTYNNVIFKGIRLGSPIQYFGGTDPGYGALGCILTWRQLKP